MEQEDPATDPSEDDKDYNDANHHKEDPTDLSSLHLLWVPSCHEGFNIQGTSWNNAFLIDRRRDAAKPASVAYSGLPQPEVPS